MTRYYILLILFPILLSCNNERSTKSLIVGDKGFNYWLDTSSDSVFYFDYLDKNGKWLVFVRENGIFEKHETPYDVIRTEKWNLQDDSTIIIGESSIRRLLKLTKDSMIFTGNLREEKAIFIIAPDSLIPKEYRKMQ